MSAGVKFNTTVQQEVICLDTILDFFAATITVKNRATTKGCSFYVHNDITLTLKMEPYSLV